MSKENEKLLGYVKLVVLTNQQRFLESEYDRDSPILDEAKLDFIDIPYYQFVQYHQISETVVAYEDNLIMAITGLTNKEEKMFSIEPYQ